MLLSIEAIEAVANQLRDAAQSGDSAAGYAIRRIVVPQWHKPRQAR